MRKAVIAVTLAVITGGKLTAQTQPSLPVFPYDLRSNNPHEINPFLKTDVYLHSAQYNRGQDWVRIKRHQMATAASDPVSVTKQVTIAGQITEVTAREGGSEVYVAAMKSNGEALVERWVFAPRDGTYVYGTGQPIPSVGMPQPPYLNTANVSVHGGGAFSESAAAVIRDPQRTTIYESLVHGLVEDLLVEPEGRFLLMLMYQNKKVLRVDLTNPTFPAQVAYDSAQYSALSKADDLCIWIHSTEGRKYVLRELSPFTAAPQIMLIPDANNDAVFENPQTLTHAQFISAGYNVGSAWKRLWDTQ